MISRFLSFIRFSHTIFALPFALGSMFVAAHGLPSFRVFALVVMAMVFARTAAMTFNRLADWEIDKRNPRTAGRHKLVSKRLAIGACLLSALSFVGTAWMINPLCFALSPVALLIVFFYSLTKRFTHGAQFFLGLALGVAPIGAWIAVTGSFAMPPLVLGASVLCWVAGFDIIYATQDLDVDRREGFTFHGRVARSSPGARHGDITSRVRAGRLSVLRGDRPPRSRLLSRTGLGWRRTGLRTPFGGQGNGRCN